MAKVYATAFMDEFAARPKWLALSTAPEDAPVSELRLEDGYSRVPLVESDWHDGSIAPKPFGPAVTRWEIRSLALLSASGSPVLVQDVSFTLEPGWVGEVDFTGIPVG